MKGFRPLLLAVCLSAGFMGVDGARAASSPVKTTMGTSASVTNTCRIVSLDSVSFGGYSTINSTASASSGTLQLICTKATVATAVPTSGGSAMAGPGGSIAYGLYTDSAMSKVWGKPTTLTATLNLDTTTVYFANNTQTTSSSCAALANGTVYYWRLWSPSGNCFYGYSATPTAAGAPTISAGAGLVVGSGVLVNPQSSSYGSFYLPAGSTQVSGHTYTVVTGQGSQATLSGTSTSATAPVSLTYYAKAAGGQDVTPGAYLDTVMVQVSF